MRFFKRLDTFVSRFLVSYMITLIVPSLFIIFIYVKTVDMVEQDIKASNLSMLEQGRDILDKHFQEVNSNVERMALNPRVISLAYIDEIKEGSKDIDLLISAANDLSVYRLTDSFVKEIFIYFKESDIIITTTAANTRMRFLYGNYFKFGDMSYAEWASNMTENLRTGRYIPSTPVNFNGRRVPVITYLQSVPLEYPQIKRGCIMVFIDADTVNRLLQKINNGYNGYTYILDKNNTMITSVCPDGKDIDIHDMTFDKAGDVMKTKISGREMVVSYTVSSYNGWKYITLVPAEFVMMKVNYIRRIISYAAAALLIVGLMLSMLLTYKNAKPIKDIVNSLKELMEDDKKYKNEYAFISGTISSLIKSNRDFRRKLDEQQPVIQADFLKRLLYGHYSDIEEINANLSHLDIRLSGAGFVVMILKILGYRDLINKNILKELDISRVVITQTIEDISGGEIASCDLDEANIALVMSFDTKDRTEIRARAERMAAVLYEELLKRKSIYTCFSAGSICGSLADIGYSFADAKQAMEQNTAEQKKPVWYDEVPNLTGSCKYSISMEKKLIDLVMSGEGNELKKLLNIIYKENFKDRKLSCRTLKLFIYQLRGTLSRVVDQTGSACSKTIIDEFSYAGDLELAFHSICRCLRDICDAINAGKSSRDDILLGKILNYLNIVYMREDLTIYSVASHFSLNETYLYHFFKEKKGMTFANYLEKLRMENAYSLLTETDITICDIASRVGYGSVHSFRRAFKRCMGYIPSELRNA